MTISILYKKSNIALKVIRFFCILLGCFSYSSLASQPLTYLKTAQVNALNFGMALTPTYDSGYVMVGQDKQYIIQADVYCFFYITKIDKCGNMAKELKFEFIGPQPRVRSAGGRFVKETSDHKYLMTGAVQRSWNLVNDTLSLFAALVDLDGNTLNWFNIYRKCRDATGTCAAEASDGYLICGFVDAEPKKPYIAKVSKIDGSIIWDHAFPSLQGLYSYANYVDVFSNGDILLLGSYGNGSDNNFFAMRLSPTGSIIWSKEYDIGPFDGLDWDVSGRITQDGGFLISGSTKPGSNFNCVIIKADANGTVMASTTIDKNGNDDRARGITEMVNGTIVQTGFTNETNGDVYTLVNKVAADLTPLWSRNLTFNNYSKGWGINEDVDKGIVFSGETMYPPSDYEALFVKTDSMGNLPNCPYLPLISPVFTPQGTTAVDISPTVTTSSYFEFAYASGGISVLVTGGTMTDNCYNCVPVLEVSTNKICLNESMYVYSKEIRCSPQTIVISDTATSQTVPAVSSNSDTTYYHFTTAGTYHITLTLDCGGVTQTTIKTLVVDPPPIASAGNDFTKCKYQSVPVTGTGGVSYQWYNEDFSTLLSTNNPFYANDTAEKVYNVVVTDINGCIDTADVKVSVTLPHAKFVADSACLHQPSNFTDQSTVLNQTFASWLWDFGDMSALDTAHNPTHIFPNYGLFYTTLIATTANGCKDTIQKTILVHPLPSVNFNATPVPVGICDGTPVSFYDLTTIPLSPYNSIAIFNWNLGDGSPINTGQNVIHHLYDSANTYDIQLVAISNFGCKDSILKKITINPNPVVNFSADKLNGCEPLCIAFTDLSTISPTLNVQWTWNPGDGSPVSNSLSFEHCYTNDSVFAPNSFNITLTVTSDSGCVTTGSKNNYITVYPNPVADFNIDPTYTTLINPVFEFINLSTGADFWDWNFGDNHTSTLQNPEPNTYPAVIATYTIALTTTTQYGCYDTTSRTIEVGPDFVFYIPNAFTPNADGVNDYFFGKGIGIIKYDIWIFDRWGNMIFHGEDLNDKWNGKANDGKDIAQIDVYVWKVKLTDVFQKKHSYIGTVTLVK